ncbi:MAG: serine/threonine protein kinase [Actinomycetota bacterium]|nr:serine/threonine protein kinase [Actinomycetota bacterium]
MTTAQGTASEGMYVGRYRLIGLLGEGGMGVVHLAEAPSGRLVAMKVLRPHILGDHEARERLAREVGSLRRINSPWVAGIVDADPHGPVPFVVTRYVPGWSLHELVRERGTMPEADLLGLAEGLTEALRAVHQVGVLHRDIKPTNVLMEGRSPVLIDFGLARLAEDPRLTATGWLMGTPGYLAPEVLYGEEATAASDVHALAATIGYAALGRPPAGTGPTMAVLDRVRRGEYDLTGVPGSLRRLLEACLAPDAGDRPTLAAIRGELARVRSGLDAARPEAWARPDDETPAPPATRMLTSYQPSLAAAGATALRAGRTSSGERLGLCGAGLFASALAAYAPYAGTALVVFVAAMLRLASVVAQRHGRRQALRGRPRWYDVPMSVLASPGYLVLSLVGTVVLGLSAVTVAAATAVAMAIVKPPQAMGLVIVGVALVLALWWGPGSSRVREMARRSTRPLGGEPGRSRVALAIGIAGAVVLIAALASKGPTWAPKTGAPWSQGFVAQLAKVL